MMSIAKVSNPKYHLEHSQFDYYSEQENEKGEFRGALMKWQKLEGKEVDEKNYMKQIEHGGEDNKGVDLCFSPPKDWTLLYNLVDDETRLKMDSIRDKAVNSIVKGIEQNTYYRETKDGETSYKLARGVGMATFNHHSGREVNDKKINPDGYVDCQEHTHITVFPKVLGQDGKFHSHTLLEMKYEKANDHETLRYLDQLGQYELCKGLQDLGFNVYEKDKHGNFAIEGITDDLRDNFSKRAQQINDKAEDGASYNDKQKVSLKFRATKDNHDLASLREIWKDGMKELGFDKDKVNEMKNLKTEQHKDRNLDELLTDKEKNKSISNKKIKTLALRESKFSDKSYKDKLDEFKEDKKVRKVSKNNNIYADKKSKEKLCDKLDKNKEDKKIKQKKSKEKNKNQPSNIDSDKKPDFKDTSKNKDENKNNSMPVMSSLSSGDSKNEIISNIKDLELQLWSLPQDGTLETNLKRGQIEEQIGNMKKQLKEMEEQESKNISAMANNGDSQSLDNGFEIGEIADPKKQPLEEQEEEILNKHSGDLEEIDNIQKRDILSNNKESRLINDVLKSFNNDHEKMVENFLEKSQQLDTQITTEMGE